MELVGVCESAVIDRLERQGTPNTHTLRVRRVRAQGDAQADLTGLDPNPKGWRSTLVRCGTRAALSEPPQRSRVVQRMCRGGRERR